MADTGNLLFDVSTEVGEEIFRAKKEAMKAKPIEFGKRSASASEWRDTVRQNSSFKDAEPQRLGMKGFLAQWRGKQK